MRRVPRARLLAVSALLLAAAPAFAQPADRGAIDRAIAAVYPSLVRISAVVADFRDGRELRTEVSGSGTIVSADGFVITNHHVAGRARRILCTLADRQTLPADLVGTDPLSDIAILKLRPSTPRSFPAARFGRSSTLRQGDPVLAMGSPRALSQSVTRGIVSNAEMTIPNQGSLSLDGEDVGALVRWIGHDAAIYPGNSGGPLVNLAGEIVGINEISLGLGGAIPGDLAGEVAAALMRDGRVRRSWAGLDVQPVMTTDARRGALVAWVADGSPAADAGVRAGDVITRVNTTDVDVRYAEQLAPVNQVLYGLPIGTPARVVVLREGGERPLSITPVERPAATSWPVEVAAWGMVASNLTAFEARALARETTDGVRVISLRAGGAADQAKPRLAPDDIILAIDGQPVRSVADLETRTRDRLAREPIAGVLVEVARDRERRLGIVPLAIVMPPTPPPAEAHKAWVPVDVQVLTPDLADRIGLGGQSGVRVTAIIDDRVPLQPGDVILAVDGEAVRASASGDQGVFAAMIRRRSIGASVSLSLVRAGQRLSVPIALVSTPPVAREMAHYESTAFGFRVRDLAEGDRRDPRERALPGVLVDAVQPGSWASLARLADGDVILGVDGHGVATVGELKQRLDEATTRRAVSMAFYVRRGVRTQFLELQPSW